MAIARMRQIDAAVVRWYHCITRCVCRAFLLGEGTCDRKAWIENRIQELAQVFAVAVGGFAVMTNHLHLLLRLDPTVAEGWTDEEVVRRWGRLFPPRDKSRQPLPVSEDWVQDRLNDEESLWLCTIEDRRPLDSSREGMLAGFSLGSYLLLVDYTSRLFRAGKATISAELAGMFDRLGTTGESWRIRLEKLSTGRLFGRFFAASRDRLTQEAGRLGVRSVRNLGGCPAR